MRDTLTRAVEGDDEALQVIIDNVNTYVEVVHHTDYTLALMQCAYRNCRVAECSDAHGPANSRRSQLSKLDKKDRRHPPRAFRSQPSAIAGMYSDPAQ